MARVSCAGWMSAALIFSLSACSPARPDWTAAGVSAEETRVAWRECQAVARSSADVSYAARDGGSGGTLSGGATRSPLETYDRQKAQRLYQGALNSCMRGKGFFPKQAR